MSPKDIFTIVESLNCEFISLKLNLTSFASILTYIFMSGSGPGKLLNTDPDPQHSTFCTGTFNEIPVIPTPHPTVLRNRKYKN